MTSDRMHDDEVATDAPLVSRLIASQFPHWSDLAIEPIPATGTDHAIYRLGDDMAVRLPRIHWATGQVAKEQQWLPQLAPLLPLAVPVPIARGEPGFGYPWHWSVVHWLEGDCPAIETPADPRQATDLAEFVAALQRTDAAGGPPPGQHNSHRGVPLSERDAPVRAAIEALGGMLDTGKAMAVWEASLRAPPLYARSAWIHGDLIPTNLLAQEGRLTAVIDFGCLGVGDPATDVMAAWTFLSAETRNLFRDVLQVDDATWARGRGWALSFGLIALPYYQDTNPMLAGIARRAIDQVLGDQDASV